MRLGDVVVSGAMANVRHEASRIQKMLTLAEAAKGTSLEVDGPVFVDAYGITIYAGDNCADLVRDLAAELEVDFRKDFDSYGGRLIFSAEWQGFRIAVSGKPGPDCRLVKKTVQSESSEYELVCDEVQSDDLLI